MRSVTRRLIYSLILGGISSGCSAGTTYSNGSIAVDSQTSIAHPSILSRKEWHAKPPLPGMEIQQIRGIILHHTGVHSNGTRSLELKMQGLQVFSQNPGEVSRGLRKPTWPDVPYHFYVDTFGKIAEGRSLTFAGDTNTGYNTSGYIQIVIEGDFETEVPRPEQLTTARDLVAWLLVSSKLPVEAVTLHNMHASTDCPGRNLMAAIPRLLSQIKEKISHTTLTAPN